MKTWDDINEIAYWNIRVGLRHHSPTIPHQLDAVWQPILRQVRDQVKMDIIYELRGFGYER